MTARVPPKAVEAAMRALREHSTWSADLRAGEGFRCICGADGPEFGRIEGWECHQAEAVAAAVVAALDLLARDRETAAKALEQAADKWQSGDGFTVMAPQGIGIPAIDYSQRALDWLRARATALRAGE